MIRTSCSGRHHVTMCLLLSVCTLTDGRETLSSQLASKASLKLSPLGWYGSVRLLRFHVPEDTVLARWTFSVSQRHTVPCGQHNVSIHLQYGAPPVINPPGSTFPNASFWSPGLTLVLPVTSSGSTSFNLTHPAPGDWYVGAHLPPDHGRIQQKGFPSCAFFFQPQLSVRRLLDSPVLQPGTSLQLTAAPDQLARCKVYVPEFASSLSVSLTGCRLEEGAVAADAADGGNCTVIVRLGSDSLSHGPVVVNCSGISCSASLSDPPWGSWLRVVVESDVQNHTVTFDIVSNYTVGCKPRSVDLNVDDDKLRANVSDSGSNADSAFVFPPSACVWSVPVLSEELDVLSLRYSPVNGPNVSVTHSHATMLTYPLRAHATGGTLNLQLTLNTTNVTLGNSVTACLSPWAPVLELNPSRPCRTGLFGGFRLHVNVSVPEAAVRLPFPQSTTWYLTLQLTCNSSDCGNVPVVSVVPDVFVSACVDDCGTFGECRLLRTYSYLYAACVCKAGWRGWGCTDGSRAQTFRRQLTATLLLTLSNVAFLPAVVVAVTRNYVAESAVYVFTMFFSTFYHACDQPGVAVLCILDYDTLQFCDFLGSVCSVWVTVLCMARLPDAYKHTLFVLGVLLISMSMQLDRTGLWNLLAPVLCAIILMLSAWVYRGVRRRHCYPPSWKRWVLFLVPGAMCALVGLCLYAFAETENNYYYTHSLWHVLVAGCVVFLLPPRDRDRTGLGLGLGWTRGWTPRVCGYTLCQSGKDELYTVT